MWITENTWEGILDIIGKVKAIAERYIAADDIDNSVPLTLRPYLANAHDIAAIFIDIENEFAVDLNDVFSHSLDYSIESIAAAVAACSEA